MADSKQMDPRQGTDVTKLLEIDPDKIGSPALVRLIKEIRNDGPTATRVYDRIHHRHNR